MLSISMLFCFSSKMITQYNGSKHRKRIYQVEEHKIDAHRINYLLDNNEMHTSRNPQNLMAF